MTMQPVTAAPAAEPALHAPELAELTPYDPEADRRAVAEAAANSPEIDALTSTIDVNDMSTIVTFGARTAEAISTAADGVLRSMSMTETAESSRLMSALARIMQQFDASEFRDSPGLFGRLFGGAKKQADKIMGKYQTMGDEVDRIYVELRKYEEEIMRSSRDLDRMFEANVGYYHELVKTITAGEQGLREIEAYTRQRAGDYERTRDPSITFELQTLQQAQDMLRQRVQDLRTAEIVAMQSIPMIRTMQYNNLTLVRKINSAFIITLPVFKQALAQAILLKRQLMQSEAVSALDRRTQEMLIRNARGTAESARLAARAAGGPAIRTEALEESWKTIVSGIDETREIQQANEAQRRQDQARLEQIRRDYEARSQAGGQP